MIHYVKPTDTVGSVSACGLLTMFRPNMRVTIFKRGVTCANCRRLLGLKRRKPQHCGSKDG